MEVIRGSGVAKFVSAFWVQIQVVATMWGLHTMHC